MLPRSLLTPGPTPLKPTLSLPFPVSPPSAWSSSKKALRSTKPFCRLRAACSLTFSPPVLDSRLSRGHTLLRCRPSRALFPAHHSGSRLHRPSRQRQLALLAALHLAPQSLSRHRRRFRPLRSPPAFSPPL